MADIIIHGKEYDNANSVTIPKSDETGDAVFRDTSDANATTSDILTGRTAYNSSGKITGAIPINTTSGITEITDKAQTVTFNAGFYPSAHSAAIGDSAKNYIVSENIKAGISILGVQGSYTNATGSEIAATANDIVEGKTAYINGEKLTGVMVNNGAVGGTIATKDGNVVIPAGYTSGGTVSLAASEALKLQSSNIRKNVTILGVTGDNNVVDTSSATATASDILVGKIAYSKGRQITGTYSPGAGNEYELITGSWLTYTGQYVNAEADMLRWGLAYDASLPNVTSIADYAMCYDRSCGDLYMAKLETIGQSAFFSNVNIEKLDAGALTLIDSAAFRNAVNFATLIIRNTNSVATLSATSAFTGTKIGGGTGYVYVPDALLSNYKSTTNWSTYANQIKGLSELP